MNAPDACELTVILEDKRSNMFARRVIEALGFNMRRARFLMGPAAAGAGEQWVRLRYVSEVQAHRPRRNRLDIRLLAVVDADTNSVEERQWQMDDDLAEAGQERRTAKEAIALWIPKRHIETWLESLRGAPVTEEDDVKRTRPSNMDIPKAAREFVRLFHAGKQEPVQALPSILMALDEAKRIRQ